LGAGSAGIGLADLLCSAMVKEGLTLEEAQSRVYMFDINGLLETTRTDLADFQKPYAHKHAPTRDFVAGIESIKPTTIIGVSTVGGTFTQQVIEAMSRINVRPMVCSGSSVLRNPTNQKLAECLGFTGRVDQSRIHDVVIVGAGPAGLAAAVYAASEGLDAV
jgi:malate dehydrogenase (oxaloacetate-decarboxylating)(NADP+)